MILSLHQGTILAYLYENRNDLPVDANLNAHCLKVMNTETREAELRAMQEQGLIGSQTGFSGYFIAPSGTTLLLQIRAEEAAIKRKKRMKAGLAVGAAAALVLLVLLLK